MIDFGSLKITREEADLISQIAKRLVEIHPGRFPKSAVLDLSMSLEACHALACPLDLEAMALAPASDLLHDVVGIHHHLDRDTGTRLKDCFVPRYSTKSPEPGTYWARYNDSGENARRDWEPIRIRGPFGANKTLGIEMDGTYYVDMIGSQSSVPCQAGRNVLQPYSFGKPTEWWLELGPKIEAPAE